MPPRIRTRASKALKENIHSENKLKPTKNTKAPRKALADKTNSASDDTSVEVPRKEKVEDIKPRRDRRLPNRFLGTNLPNKENVNVAPKRDTVNIPKSSEKVTVQNTPTKPVEQDPSFFKTPSKTETSILVTRPKRICRLPSRFEDHSISPHKYIPIQPTNASTPKQIEKGKKPVTEVEINNEINKPGTPNTRQQNTAAKTAQVNNKINEENVDSKQNTVSRPSRSVKRLAVQKTITKIAPASKKSPDTNNNAKTVRSTRAKKVESQPNKNISTNLDNSTGIRKFFNKSSTLSPSKPVSPKPNRKVNANNLSFKVLGGKKQINKSGDNDLDIYEFTFDPTEEPLTKKKKPKRVATKRPSKNKPKTQVKYKSTYDQNISKALSALKKAVKPSTNAEVNNLPQIQEISGEAANIVQANSTVKNSTNMISRDNHAYTMNDSGKTSVHECNYPSIRVEDIAADIEPTIEHCDDLNYSPVNSPRPITSNLESDTRQSPERVIHNTDPLNLQQELSFFDDVPVASSSMNMSVRHPLASPWRVEFGNLPIKWHSNTYVKPNMTPAVESSFICSKEYNEKKHVYTNMMLDNVEPLPQEESNTPNLKQPSIISFIREVAERKAKKKRGRSVSPSKAVSVVTNPSVNIEIPIQTENNSSADPPPELNIPEEVSSGSNNLSDNKENSRETRSTRKRKNNENVCNLPAKSPRKQKDCTFFGFDDSEDQEQENVSPVQVKNNPKGRTLRARGVLQEVNGPTRAALPVAAKSKAPLSSEVINKVYEGAESAAIAPVFPEKNVEVNLTNVEDPSFNDESQSVHLFEDVDVVHHLKPVRKSYGKPKKVTFRQHSTCDSRQQEVMHDDNNSSFEDDLADLTFEVPNIKEKKKYKKKPKKLMSKKEEKEAEEWAAGFNSMCEEMEDFPLVVE